MDYSIYLNELKQVPFFNREMLWRLQRRQMYDITLAKSKYTLQDMLSKGLIARIGRNAYIVREQIQTYQFKYSPISTHISDILINKYPYGSFRIFETIQLNEFLNHQIAHNLIFIAAESNLDRFIFHALRKMYPRTTVLLRPTKGMFYNYWSDGMIIIEKLPSESPRDNNVPWHTAIEKILVDIIADHLRKLCFEETELPNIYEEAMNKYIIDESRMFRYARRRNVEKKLRAFLAQKTNIRLRTEKK